jgi:hypothetical protein
MVALWISPWQLTVQVALSDVTLFSRATAATVTTLVETQHPFIRTQLIHAASCVAPPTLC